MSQSDSSGYTFQYSIRLPNGALYCKPKQTAHSAMAYMFGVPAEPERELAVFNDIADAEALLDEMLKHAREVGVDNLGATIVTRLCSPFLADSDDAAGFVAHIAEWMAGKE